MSDERVSEQVQNLFKKINAKHVGQGVVEYAGALVIASTIIGIAVITLPEGAYEFLVEIQEGILEYLVGELDEQVGGGA